MIGKRYLGDGVYAEAGPYAGCITLTTEDGVRTTNTIVLEPEVLDAAIKYRKDFYAEVRQRAEEQARRRP